MLELLNDIKIINIAERIIGILNIVKTALTVGIIVFSVLESVKYVKNYRNSLQIGQ